MENEDLKKLGEQELKPAPAIYCYRDPTRECKACGAYIRNPDPRSSHCGAVNSGRR